MLRRDRSTSPATSSRSSCTSSRSWSASGRPSATRSSSRSRRQAPAQPPGDRRRRAAASTATWSTPAMIVILVAGHLPAGRRRLGAGRRLHQRRLRRDHRPVRPAARVLQPADRSKASGAGRARPGGRRRRSATSSAAARRTDRHQSARSPGLIVVVTIFFMIVQALCSEPDRRPSTPLPIAMFDSGVGGLTVLHECLVSLPEEDFLYLGDTRPFPYGTKTPSELRERIARDRRAACSTAARSCWSSPATRRPRRRGRRPRGRRRARGRGGDGGRARGRDRRGDHRQRPGRACSRRRPRSRAAPTAARSSAQGRALEVTEVAAPDLAPIIQHGFPFDEGVIETVRSYCAPLKRAEVDTLILGCTHYPLVAPMLQRMLGRDVRLVTAGHAVAAAAQRTLEARASPVRARRRGRLPLPLHRRRRVLPRARHPLPADAARRGRARRAAERPATTLSAMSETILERVQADTRAAMKAGERERVGALRMIVDALQQDAKLGEGDEVAVLQRERKKRLEAAEAFARAGRDEQAAAEQRRGGADRGLPARAALRRGARRAGRRRRSRRPAPPSSKRDGQGDAARDAEGRRARRRQAGQRRRCGSGLARRQLTLDNTVAAELAGSEDAVLRALRGPSRLRRSTCAATCSRSTATPATCRRPRPWSTSWSS